MGGGKTINLSSCGEREITVDLARLAMVEFSQDGRQMLVRHTDGTQVPYQSESKCFDIARITRLIQVNAPLKFEACDNSAIVSILHVKYAITQTPDMAGQVALSLGVSGHQRVEVCASTAAAKNMIDRMNRVRPTLNCQLAQGGKIHMYPSTIVYAEHRSGSDIITLDFADAGKVNVQPVATQSGFLTSKWTTAMAGIFPARECELCPGVIERLSFQNEKLSFVKTADGVAVMPRVTVQRAAAPVVTPVIKL